MPKILLIDDDVSLMERLVTLLTEAGYIVLRASRMQHAELLIAEQRPDLVVLDPDIGQGDGWLLLGQSARQLPMIIVSGQALEEDIVRGLDAGAVDYLPKPFRTGELLARIRARLREQAVARSAGGAPDEQPAPPATGQTVRLDPPVERPPVRAGRDRRGALAPGDQEEPIFISHGEESRLLHEPDLSDRIEQSDIAAMPLGQRLHAARQRKRLSLVQAELETRPSVPMHYIQAMEEEKFSLLPRGELAEELLRTYARYLGLDVTSASEEYRRLHYNAPVEPPTALGGSPLPRRLPRWIIWLAAVVLALVVGIGGIWLYDPRGIVTLAQRARIGAPPPTATATPTLLPTATTTPTATATPTATIVPTATPEPPTATVTPRRR